MVLGGLNIIISVGSWTLPGISLSCYQLVAMAWTLDKRFLDNVSYKPSTDSFLQMKEQNLAAASFAPRVRDTMPVPLIKNMNKKLPGLEAR